MAQFITPMSIAGTGIALPQISTDLGTNTTALQWVVNGFNAAFALGVLGWGAVSDRIGYRMTFAIGSTLFSLSSLISAASPSLLLLDCMRIVAGVGAAAVLTGASSMLSNAYEGNARGRAFALFGTINGLGLTLGPTISGILVSSFGWRGVFAVHGAILALVSLNTRFLPAANGAVQDPKETKAPLLDLSILKNREFLAMCLVPIAGSIGFVTMLTYLPSAFSGIKGIGPGRAGLIMLAMTIPVVVAPMLVAKLIEKVSWITVGFVVYLSLICLIVGDLGLVLLTPEGSIGLVIAPMILLGLGFGLPIGLVDGHALEVVPPERTGTAAGVLNFFRVGSEALFVAGYAFILSVQIRHQLSGEAATNTAAGQPGHPDVYADAFGTSALMLTVLVLLVTVSVVLVRRSPSSKSNE
ncbi:MFS transporter [Corynebacterium glaucum]|uniref:MFS transporter n=1 Tax=Corynebacterium glaucum TaxID=187491 RepID=UPI00265AC643|nr:MFS transporter [Corynebacterium glaucum]